MEIEYGLYHGITMNGCDLPWGISREEARAKLNLPYRVQDTVTDFSKFGIDKIIEQRRDIYGDLALGNHYIFLGFDNDSNLRECELHLFGSFRIGDIILFHEQPIEEVLDLLARLSQIRNETGHEQFDYPALKMSVASSDGMGGEEGDHGLSYIYIAANVDHWQQ